MSADYRHQARKRFGQHFLHDPRVIDRIIDSFAPATDDLIVEIGPGHGALTRALLSRSTTVYAVELDRDLIGTLQAAFGEQTGLTLFQADALAFDFCGLAHDKGKLRVIGNLPYNISTPLLFHLLDQADCIADMCFMLQKEVVDRLAAAPGGKDYGRLSVMVQWRCQVRKLFDVGHGAFKPPPKVDSSVVRLVPRPTPETVVNDPARFARIVRDAFAQRRKTLRNALKGMLSADEFHAAGIDPGRRAETLSVEEFITLSNSVGHKVP